MASPGDEAFNNALGAFIDTLEGCFPERSGSLAIARQAISALAAMDPKSPAQHFLNSVSPHLPAILARDPSVFEKLDLGGAIDIRGMWRDPGLSDSSRDAIWSYLSSLCMLATTARLPPSLLALVEKTAASAAADVQSGSASFEQIAARLMDPASLQAMLSDIQAAGPIDPAALQQVASLAPMLGPLLGGMQSLK